MVGVVNTLGEWCREDRELCEVRFRVTALGGGIDENGDDGVSSLLAVGYLSIVGRTRNILGFE